MTQASSEWTSLTDNRCAAASRGLVAALYHLVVLVFVYTNNVM